MKYGEMLAAVRDRDPHAGDDADRITEAVVRTLGNRLAPASAEHLADQLPRELSEILEDSQAAPRTWGVREFVHQVAQSTDADGPTAEQHTRAVLSVIADEVSGGELNKLISQLPSGFAPLFGKPELA
ncbi:hypothetical protein GCM10027168_25780 [Streptomyces capparidis]